MNDVILMFLVTVFAFANVFVPKLYITTHKYIYYILSYATILALVPLLFMVYTRKFSLITVAIFVKIIPLMILSGLSFFVFKDSPFTIEKGIGMLMAIAGIILIER